MQYPRTSRAPIPLLSCWCMIRRKTKRLLGRHCLAEGRYSTTSLSRGNRWKRPSPARFVKIGVKSVTSAITRPTLAFSASIMLGFHAEAKTTEIFRRDDELEDAQWFSRDDVMNFPKLSAKTCQARIPSPDA